jgi:membrane-associated protease RseP (regulator of RpoE activity)
VGSPAAQAGIEAGDEVLAVNGRPVRRHAEIKEILGPLDAGSEVELRLRRDGNERTVTAQLVAEIPPFNPQSLGVLLEEVAAADLDADQAADGEASIAGLRVRAVYSDSPAAAAGLRVDDVIRRVGEDQVAGLEDFRQRVMTLPEEAAQQLEVDRDGENLSLQWASRAFTDQWPLTEIPLLPSEDQAEWEIQELQLPDVENRAAMVGPEDDVEVAPLGLLVVFAEPGNQELEGTLGLWRDVARQERVVVALLSSADTERWSPDEAELAARVAAMIKKRFPIQSYAVGVTGNGAGGTMAIIAAFSDPSTFSGFSVAAKVKPPAVRLRENDPGSPLHVLIQRVGEELPPWAQVLSRAGYALVDAPPDRQSVLRFVWALGRI